MSTDCFSCMVVAVHRVFTRDLLTLGGPTERQRSGKFGGGPPTSSRLSVEPSTLLPLLPFSAALRVRTASLLRSQTPGFEQSLREPAPDSPLRRVCGRGRAEDRGSRPCSPPRNPGHL